jgi:hypothetical protein
MGVVWKRERQALLEQDEAGKLCERTSNSQMANIISIASLTAVELTGRRRQSHSTGVQLSGVPLAMSKIPPRWSAESTDRLLATDDILARGAEEDEEEEEEDEEEEEEDGEDENDSEDEDDGYSE